MGGVLVIGSSNTDLVCRTARLPIPGETVTGQSYSTFAGGKGANQAVAAARAGATVTFVGAHGNDDFGRGRKADLEADGIDVSRLKCVSDLASGVALIVVDDRGENQIVFVPGANASITSEDAASALAEVDHSVVSLTFEAPYDVVAQTVRDQRRTSKVVLNAAPFDERIEELLSHLDVLICNEVEAAAVLGHQVTAESAERDARAIRERGPEAVIITLGGQGVVAADASGSWHTAAHDVVSVDSTGAGDAFCGTVCAWLAAGESLAEAVRAGSAAGALAVTRAGAQPSLPRRDEILARMG